MDKKAEEDDEYAEKHSNPSSDDEDEEGEEEIEVEQLEVSVFVCCRWIFLTLCFIEV